MFRTLTSCHDGVRPADGVLKLLSCFQLFARLVAENLGLPFATLFVLTFAAIFVVVGFLVLINQMENVCLVVGSNPTLCWDLPGHLDRRWPCPETN